MTSECIAIASDRLSATISRMGAELRTLRDGDGRDLLWSGDPAFWTGRAPILFPVVGKVADDLVRVAGRPYPMDKHGFARHSQFAVIAADAQAVNLQLQADDTTRASYPFDFALDVRFSIEAATLTMTATVHNRGEPAMPASFGYHPAFRWPLPYGRPREAHAMRFAAPEPGPIRRIDATGLIRAEPEPSPIKGDLLRLRDALFEDDAMILDRPVSRGLRYGADDGPALAIEWDLPQLGLWTKPGAGYICVEPWQGHADPVGYAGELAAKPGVVILQAGESKSFTMRVTLTDAA